jgi:signal transduction histidine kinase
MSATLKQPRWVGAVLGFIVSLVDIGFARLVGMRFLVGERELGGLVWLYLAASFVGVGWLLGYLVELRRGERDHAARLDEAHARLRSVERLAGLGQLAASVAHEVRNPLAIIRSSVQNVAEVLPATDAESLEACDFVVQEIDRLNGVVNGLLSLARAPTPAPRAVLVSALVERAELLGGRLLAHKGLKLERGAALGLPPVQVDEDLMAQVLLGLVSNAGDASPPGGVVRITARADDGGVTVSVSDEGPGVPEALRERVFEPFFTTRESGHGLGLAVAQQIVEAHGGRITVADAPGGGARLDVQLPVAQ